MDPASKQIVRFLDALQDLHRRIVKLQIRLQQEGVRCSQHFITLSGRPFGVASDTQATRQFGGALTVGFHAQRSNRSYEVTLMVLWKEDGWIVMTDVMLEGEEGQELIREFPERFAPDIDTCLAELHAAMNDLETCEDLFSLTAAQGTSSAGDE